MEYQWALAVAGLVFGIASAHVAIEGYSRIARVLQIAAAIHVSPLLITLWARMFLGGG